MRKLYFGILLLCCGFIHALPLEPIKTNPPVVEKMETTVSIFYPTPICTNSDAVPVSIMGTGNYLGGTFTCTPGLAINSATGTILPAMSSPGSYVITYTVPSPDAASASYSVVITPEIVPFFDPIGPITAGSTGIILPSASNNGITGSWSPATIDTTSTGNYIFFPDPGQCAAIITLTIIVVEPGVPAPEGAADQYFVGFFYTLADIAIAGTNIQWYASASTKMADAALPLTTPLVDGATYYASQTVNGVESTSRLPVTVHLTLGFTENHLLGLTYSPNPVKSSLQLKAAETINSVTVMNLLGQVLKTTTYNQPEVSQDLSGFGKGTYFIKVVSGAKVKVIKILKD